MSEILVLIDHSEGAPRKISLQMLNAANQVAATTGDTVAAVWLGEGSADAYKLYEEHRNERARVEEAVKKTYII